MAKRDQDSPALSNIHCASPKKVDALFAFCFLLFSFFLFRFALFSSHVGTHLAARYCSIGSCGRIHWVHAMHGVQGHGTEGGLVSVGVVL